MLMEIRKVAVIGMGTMGSQIADVFKKKDCLPVIRIYKAGARS
ncbi:MAG: hypothetical protein C4582_00490 [Desulfobacteraceae bacterium]|jgi:3-hydroxyacyl-CoA dehydrogenase|nr:MAG: hypothetical protein C4582_00490 [Desulfobacteraceae bacterium]